MPDSSLIPDLITCLRGLKALARKEAARHQLSMNAFIGLRVIGRAGGVTMRELAELLDVTPGACTQLVDRLAEQGLVARRSGSDRRSVHVELTPEGLALRAAMMAEIRGRFETVLAGVSPAMRGELERSVAALADAFENTHPLTEGDALSCNSPNPVAP
jgi:DNA-binding MarR family transcriptional regulator